MRICHALVLCLLLACLPAALISQEGSNIPRTVQFDSLRSEAPFEFVKVLLDGVEVRRGLPFEASNDWFERLQVVIRNTSAKKLVYVAGQLRFPETGGATAEHLAVMDRISVGRRPEHARSGDVPSREGPNGLQAHIDGAEVLVRPGQEIAVPVVDPLNHIKAAMEARQPLSSVTRCEVDIHTLYFDDGTSWVSGMYFRADQSTPGKYLRISRREFESSSGSKGAVLNLKDNKIE